MKFSETIFLEVWADHPILFLHPQVFSRQVWWCTPVIPESGRSRQEGFPELRGDEPRTRSPIKHSPSKSFSKSQYYSHTQKMRHILFSPEVFVYRIPHCLRKHFPSSTLVYQAHLQPWTVSCICLSLSSVTFDHSLPYPCPLFSLSETESTM